MSREVTGTITRQLLPRGHASSASDPWMRAEIRRAYRWVTWFVVPIAYHQIEAHLRTGGEAACIVQVKRGPNGGWTGAVFVTRENKPARKSFGSVGYTWHFGWVHLGERPKDTMPDERMWRAHLELHAPTGT